MTELRITVRNTSEIGGTFLTPVYFGFHNGDFDLFEVGQAASAGLEQLAEDGSAATLAMERADAAEGSQGIVVTGAGGPVATQEVTSGILDVDGTINTQVSLAAMILPSNDAFIGTNDAVTLFDGDGNFLGAQTLVFEGSDVYDAGTEVNTELDAAFLNQTGPNTGETEGGTVQLHPGFNGSEGNPVGDGDQIILSGTAVNAAGADIDIVAADFTRAGSQIAQIHINTVVTTAGTDERDVLRGSSSDDIAEGGAGRDVLFGNQGFDDLSGGDDRDLLFGGLGDDLLSGGGGNDRIRAGEGNDIVSGDEGRDLIDGDAGNDLIDGGADRDVVRGGAGDDALSGGADRDFLFGGIGSDLINGGTGNDRHFGGTGADTFLFAAGDGKDRVDDFNAAVDIVSFGGGDLASFEDVLANARSVGNSVRIDHTDQDFVVLRNVNLEDLTEANFDFF